MKEAKVKNVLEGELFFDNHLRQFFRRLKGPRCFCDTGDHIPAEAAKDGEKICFMPEKKVVV